MTSKHTRKDKDPLAQSLIASAENSSPSYSEHLHQRTMRAIRAQQAHMAVASRPNWIRAIAIVAAVLLVGIALWYVTSSRPSPVQPEVTFHVPDASDLIRHGSQPLKDALSGIDGSSLAQLEQDARSFARFITNQLPQSDPRSSGKPSQPKAQPGT